VETLLIALAILIVLDVASWFWGADSRVVMDDERSVERASRRWI
jgi:hypothetical protein